MVARTPPQKDVITRRHIRSLNKHVNVSHEIKGKCVGRINTNKAK
jgi:hypothetical protein